MLKKKIEDICNRQVEREGYFDKDILSLRMPQANAQTNP